MVYGGPLGLFIFICFCCTFRSQPRGRSQLPSFSLPSHGANAYYDEYADDGTVPSTPTLYVAKRTDGFAEAVRSVSFCLCVNLLLLREVQYSISIVTLLSTLLQCFARKGDKFCSVKEAILGKI